jgi:hypothetical protein
LSSCLGAPGAAVLNARGSQVSIIIRCCSGKVKLVESWSGHCACVGWAAPRLVYGQAAHDDDERSVVHRWPPVWFILGSMFE